MQKRYYYLFNNEGAATAKLDFSVLEHDAGKTDFLGIPIRYCSFTQSVMKVTGFRFGDFAYISDIQKYGESIFDVVQGVQTLVLSALKPETSPFHLSFDQAVAFARRAGAQETWLTHLGHFIDHDAGNALLPPDVRIAYDGLKLEFIPFIKNEV
jgi:phosphoribosyl 1,2-cyclic phosphate phosphodiesterase